MADVIEEGGNGVDKQEVRSKILDALEEGLAETEGIRQLAQPKVDELSELDTARSILRREQEERIQKCKVEVDAVMKKWGCTFDSAVLVSNRGNRMIINIVAVQDPS